MGWAESFISFGGGFILTLVNSRNVTDIVYIVHSGRRDHHRAAVQSDGPAEGVHGDGAGRAVTRVVRAGTRNTRDSRQRVPVYRYNHGLISVNGGHRGAGGAGEHRNTGDLRERVRGAAGVEARARGGVTRGGRRFTVRENSRDEPRRLSGGLVRDFQRSVLRARRGKQRRRFEPRRGRLLYLRGARCDRLHGVVHSVAYGERADEGF